MGVAQFSKTTETHNRDAMVCRWSDSRIIDRLRWRSITTCSCGYRGAHCNGWYDCLLITRYTNKPQLKIASW